MDLYKNAIGAVLLALATLTAVPCAHANCYTLVNNTKYPQMGRFQYSAPIGQGPVSFSIRAHGQFHDCFNAPGFSATVLLNIGNSVLMHDGKQWQLLVFGDGGGASPAGVYSIEPGPAGRVTKQNRPQVHLQVVPNYRPPEYNLELPPSSSADPVKLKEIGVIPLSEVGNPPSSFFVVGVAVTDGSMLAEVMRSGSDRLVFMRSTDGYKWLQVKGPPYPSNKPISVHRLMSNGSMYLFVSNDALYLSSDGESWRGIFTNTPKYSFVRVLSWHGNTILVRTREKLLLTEDLGLNWQTTALPSACSAIKDYGCSVAGDGRELVAAVPTEVVPQGTRDYDVREALVISHDFGKTWATTDIGHVPWGPPRLLGCVNDIIVHSATATWGSAANQAYLHVSWDGGNSWDVEPFPTRDIPLAVNMTLWNGWIVIIGRPGRLNGSVILAQSHGHSWYVRYDTTDSLYFPGDGLGQFEWSEQGKPLIVVGQPWTHGQINETYEVLYQIELPQRQR